MICSYYIKECLRKFLEYVISTNVFNQQKIFLIVVTNMKYTRQEWQPLTFPSDISRNSLQVTEIHTRSK